MRKMIVAMFAFVVTVGLTLAAPVRLVKYDEKTKEVTVKEGKKGEETEKTYKITDKTKFKQGDKEVPAEEALKKFVGEKAVKGFDLTAKDGNVEEVKFLEKKKKDKN
jgi:preprotein translocase subunit SecD